MTASAKRAHRRAATASDAERKLAAILCSDIADFTDGGALKIEDVGRELGVRDRTEARRWFARARELAPNKWQPYTLLARFAGPSR